MPDNDSQQLLAIGEVARTLELPVHVVRRWIDYHAAHLSETARPATSGTPRRLTQRDVEVLRAVKQLRSQGLTVAVINERLGSLKVGEIESAPEPTDLQPAPAAPLSPLHGNVPVVVVEALARIEERLQQVEDQRPTWRDVILIALASLAIGLMIGLSVWWFQ